MPVSRRSWTRGLAQQNDVDGQATSDHGTRVRCACYGRNEHPPVAEATRDLPGQFTTGERTQGGTERSTDPASAQRRCPQ